MMRFFILVFLLFASAGAEAYVGPGLGLGVIGAIFGAIATFFMAIAGLIWYPIKRLIRKIRGTTADDDNDAVVDSSEEEKLEHGTEQ